MPNACQWCGADIEPEKESTEVVRWYGCGTKPGRTIRTDRCYERQLARMQPVVDAAIIYRDIGTSGAEDDFFDSVDRYKEGER